MPNAQLKHLSESTKRALWAQFEREQGPSLARLLCDLSRRGHRELLSTFYGHPLADYWKDFALESLTAFVEKRKGVVYVAANPVNRGFNKVGQTKNCVEERLQSLNTAGVVGYFVKVYSVEVSDRFAVEAAAHRYLARAAPVHKEFFLCDWQTAVDAVVAAADQDEKDLEHLWNG